MKNQLDCVEMIIKMLNTLHLMLKTKVLFFSGTQYLYTHRDILTYTINY